MFDPQVLCHGSGREWNVFDVDHTATGIDRQWKRSTDIENLLTQIVFRPRCFEPTVEGTHQSNRVAGNYMKIVEGCVRSV